MNNQPQFGQNNASSSKKFKQNSSSHSFTSSHRLNNDLWLSLKLIGVSIGITGIFGICGWQITKQNTRSLTDTTSLSKDREVTIKDRTSSNFKTRKSIVEKDKDRTLPKKFPIKQELAYNVKTSPKFKKSQELQTIVDKIVDLAKAKGMPTDALSVTLVDLNSKEEASYQQEKLRFPASVVKLFWLVNLQEQLRQGLSLEDDELIADLPKMIHKSDNETASRVVDRITQTQSGSNLSQEEFNLWLDRRKQINRFFEAAGYQGINVSQKTFPIPYLHLSEPQGRELQMRGSLAKPIRNKITTQQASRLMYEIVIGQAVSPVASQKMLDLLTIDSATRIENRELQNPNIFNPVRGYLSQSLPENVFVAAKAGWTSRSRQETAYIATPDGKISYILTIFAEDKSYAYDWKIFPKMSAQVFERMKKRS
jgi:Beta-lactamase enzyme family